MMSDFRVGRLKNMGGDTSNSVSTCTCRFKKRAVALLHRKTKRTFGSQVNSRYVKERVKL